MRSAFTTFLVSFLSAIAPASFAQQTGENVPVRISSFNISNRTQEVALHWTVICRMEFARFDIQRSANGKDFESIHRFDADKFRCASPFEFLDQTMLPDAYYRVRVGDIDGNFSTERILHVSNDVITKMKLKVNGTVVGNTITGSIYSIDNTHISLRLFDMHGRSYQLQSLPVTRGYNSISFNIPAIAKGMYFITYSDMHDSGIIRFQKL